MPTLEEILAAQEGRTAPPRFTPYADESTQSIALPDMESGTVGLFFLSPDLEARISRAAKKRAIQVGELLARALDALDKESP